MSTSASVPAIFELDEDGNATGVVHYFCSGNCRSNFDPEDGHYYSPGRDAEYVSQTQCEECGVTL